MKTALVLLAAFALIGSATAWDIEEWRWTDGEKKVYVQAGDPLNAFNGMLIGSEAGTYFKGPTPYGESAGAVNMKLAEQTETGTLDDIDWAAAGSNPMTMNGVPTDQTLTLRQAGGAYSNVRSANSGDGLPELAAGIKTDQNLHFSGFYQGSYGSPTAAAGGPAVYAQFEAEGNAGVVGKAVITSFTNLEHANLRSQPGMIETSKADTWFTDADIGMKSTADMVAGVTIDGLGTLKFDAPVFSGTVTSFAGFSGGRGTGVIEANAGAFENHVMVHTGGVHTGNFVSGTFWESVNNPPAGAFPYW
jgi:hypothetical protein